MKKYIAEIEGRMRVVTKTGRRAAQGIPVSTVSSYLQESIRTGEVLYLEVDEVNKVGRGEYRHWVLATELYEVLG